METDFFKPDRSNRPRDENTMFAKSVEFQPGKEFSGELSDGRIYINESSVIDGSIWMDYYYFDIKGIETASTDELKILIENSGIDLMENDHSVEKVMFDSRKVKDALERDIWEFLIARIMD